MKCYRGTLKQDPVTVHHQKQTVDKKKHCFINRIFNFCTGGYGLGFDFTLAWLIKKPIKYFSPVCAYKSLYNPENKEGYIKI